MLDITGMFAESLEALTSTTGHTFTIDYDSSPNYDRPSTPIYDYPPTLNFDFDYSLSPSSPQFPPPPLPPPPPPRLFDSSHQNFDSTPTFDLDYNYQDSIVVNNNNKVSKNRLKDRNRHFKIICSGRPPSSLPSPEINRNDAVFERLIELDDSDLPISYGKSNFDVVINVGEEPNMKKFRSHSVILSKRSSYFRAALSSTWAKKQGDIFFFDKPNMTPKVFTVILRYLYFGDIKLEMLDIPTLLDVLVASDELVLEDLIEEIQRYFIHLDSSLLKSNLVPIISMCFNNPLFGKLLRHLLNLIRDNPSFLVTQTDIFLLQEFMFTTILEESYKLMDDWMIWNCIIKWGIGQQPNMLLKDLDKWTRFDYEKLHETINSLLKFVRFSHIPRNYFIDQVVPFLTYFKEIDNETVRYYLNIPQPLTIDSKHTLFDIGLADSILVNHTHMSRIADWIDTGKTTRPIQKQKTKKCTYRLSFPFFRKRNHDIDLLLKLTTPPPPPKKPNYTFSLLYRMTRDGSSAYHDRCLKQGPTLVIVEIRRPSGGTILVGGYNPVGFNYFLNMDLSSLSQTFIFSFGDGKALENAQMSRVQTDWSRMAIKFSNVGPCFGYDDLTINFQEMSYEFSRYFFDPGTGYLLKSEIVECEIFQVLES